MANIAASTSHTATDSTNRAMCDASKIATVAAMQSAVPRTVATSTSRTPEIDLATMNPARDSGFVSMSTSVPARRSPATAAAPVTMITSSASWARLPMNCR